MPECNRCGQCCHWMDQGKIKKCRFLVKTSDHKFWCRIYPNRLGQHIGTLSSGEKLYCTLIQNAPTDFAECPYNEGKRPLVDFRGMIT